MLTAILQETIPAFEVATPFCTAAKGATFGVVFPFHPQGPPEMVEFRFQSQAVTYLLISVFLFLTSSRYSFKIYVKIRKTGENIRQVRINSLVFISITGIV
jgi:hypothetical protein